MFFKKLACNCNSQGSNSESCDDLSGNCSCKSNVVGSKCSDCEPGYYEFPNCTGGPKSMILHNESHSNDN